MSIKPADIVEGAILASSKEGGGYREIIGLENWAEPGAAREVWEAIYRLYEGADKRYRWASRCSVATMAAWAGRAATAEEVAEIKRLNPHRFERGG